MEMLGKVRRMHLRDKVSLHGIAKTTGLSRNIIRRWLRTPEETTAPVYRRNEHPGKLTAFHTELEQALKADSHRIKQNRRTVKALFVQIKADAESGIWTMEDRLWFADTDTPEGWRHWHGVGRYHERYACMDGRWLIQTLRLERVDPPRFANKESGAATTTYGR